MFEKVRIGGAINYLLRLRKQTVGNKPTLAELALRPRYPKYAINMRKNKLSSDQAAILLISETLAEMTHGDVQHISIVNQPLFRQLSNLFVACEHLAQVNPEKFGAVYFAPDSLVADTLRSMAF